MGSRSKTDLAYIAGFLDGDGSLMLQVKKRSDGKIGKRFMCTICFYQDSRHEETLYWIRKILGIGYVSRRNDGISELRINGYKQVYGILQKLLPFIRLKKRQAESLHKAATLLLAKKFQKLDKKDFSNLVDWVISIQENNYVTKRKRTRNELLEVLGLTP